MKINKKIVGVTLLAGLITTCYALTPGGATGPATVSASTTTANTPTTNVVATVTTTTVNPTPVAEIKPVSSENNFEKEVTPLLREISRKRSTLAVKQLDREIEKLEEEAVKAQLDREKASNLVSNPVPNNVPIPTPSSMYQSSNNLNMSSDTPSDLKVLMIFGSDNDLYAKVSMGGQGGYPVRKGDILPDGRLVVAVLPNYIEVKKSKKNKKGGIEKIFASGSAEVATPNTSPMLGMPVGITPTTIMPAQLPNSALIPTSKR